MASFRDEHYIIGPGRHLTKDTIFRNSAIFQSGFSLNLSGLFCEMKTSLHRKLKVGYQTFVEKIDLLLFVSLNRLPPWDIKNVDTYKCCHNQPVVHETKLGIIECVRHHAFQREGIVQNKNCSAQADRNPDLICPIHNRERIRWILKNSRTWHNLRCDERPLYDSSIKKNVTDKKIYRIFVFN